MLVLLIGSHAKAFCAPLMTNTTCSVCAYAQLDDNMYGVIYNILSTTFQHETIKIGRMKWNSLFGDYVV